MLCQWVGIGVCGQGVGVGGFSLLVAVFSCVVRV